MASSPRARPKFDYALSAAVTSQAVVEGLRVAAVESGGEVVCTVVDDGVILRTRDDERHVWSPALHVHFVDGDSGELLRARFSPSSPVWMAFLAIYLMLACLFLASGAYGGAQWLAGASPWALIGLPVTLALAGFTYGAAFIGQGLGADEMHQLRSFVERVIQRGPG